MAIIALGLGRGSSASRVRDAVAAGITSFDAAWNYGQGLSHRHFAEGAASEAGLLHVSTKVGYARRVERDQSNGAFRHSLETDQLLSWARATADELDRPPDVLYVHNPEVSLHDIAYERRKEILFVVAETMERACREGLASSWGLATSFPRFHGSLSETILQTLLEWRDTRSVSHFCDLQLPVNLFQIDVVRDLAGQAGGALAGAVSAGLRLSASSPLAGGEVLQHDLRPVWTLLGLEMQSAATSAIALVASLPGISRICVSMSATHMPANKSAAEWVVGRIELTELAEMLSE